jgi:hypothetical protein
MEALKCPVCEGKQIVAAGFYVDAPTQAKCRSCDGNGYLLAPEQEPTRYVPMPYYPWPTYPPVNPIWPTWTVETVPTWTPNTTGTLTVTSTPWEPTAKVLMSQAV